jgi:hypothetical protein
VERVNLTTRDAGRQNGRALHYITLRYITLHYITLQYIALQYIPLHCITFDIFHGDRNGGEEPSRARGQL